MKVHQHKQCRENYEHEHFLHVLTQCDFQAHTEMEWIIMKA